MNWQLVPNHPAFIGLLLLALGLALHLTLYSRVSRYATLRLVQRATRFPSLGLCVLAPLWWTVTRSGGTTQLLGILQGLLLFFTGACLIEIWARWRSTSAALAHQPVSRLTRRFRGVGYTLLLLISSGVALAASREPAAVVVPVICSAMVFFALYYNYTMLVRTFPPRSQRAIALQTSLRPWVYPLAALISVNYLVRAWEFADASSPLSFNLELLLLAAALAACGECAIATLNSGSALSAWSPDFLRSVLWLGLGWGYLTLISGKTPGRLVLGSAFVSVGLGMALRPTLGNLAAGLVLRLARPYSIGDFILVGKSYGLVQSIDWRSTSISTRAFDVIIFSNAYIAKQVITNFSAPTRQHACYLELTLDGRKPPHSVRSTIQDALASCPRVLTQPAPEVYLHEFAKGGIRYRIRYWIESIWDRPYIEAEVASHLCYCLKRAGLEPLQPTLLALERHD